MKHLFTLLLLAISVNTFAQNLSKGISYSTKLNGVVSNGDYAPFWFSSNKYGLSSVENNSGFIRGGLFRDVEIDSLKNWKLGFGADIAVAANHSSDFIIQQLYGEIKYKKGHLTIGSKQMPLIFKNEELSTGDMAYGINARPIPQIRLELDEYWDLPLTDGWFGFKGHISYGCMTDGGWQKDFIGSDTYPHCENVLFHSKSGYIKIGKENIFPITFTAGVHFCAQFGGESWNTGKRLDDKSGFSGNYVKNGSGLSSFWHAFYPGGRDATDGSYDNAEGNQLGSYQACLEYKGKTWSSKIYAEHFFEDHSQMFFQYDWKDFLWGLEVNLPKNPYVSTVVVEHIGTEDQSGCVYHDHTTNLPTQLSGVDNYYNHNIYNGWQHWGQGIGNPTIISPVYNKDGRITFYNNRINVFHIGLSGEPISSIHYRILYTHTLSRGTYQKPNMDPLYANYLMAEITYLPSFVKGCSLTCAYGMNRGSLIGKSDGAMLSIKKTGLLSK